MATVVSREQAKATWFTGLAGLLILVAAFVMMACAAPSLVHPQPHAAGTQATTVYTTSLIIQSWSGNRADRDAQLRP
jgi:hypothetical protein